MTVFLLELKIYCLLHDETSLTFYITFLCSDKPFFLSSKSDIYAKLYIIYYKETQWGKIITVPAVDAEKSSDGQGIKVIIGDRK